jgi:hypothetical protein
MIVSYNYNQQVEPPAPFIYVTVIAPDPRAGEVRYARIPMQLDIGAALTVIPQRLMGELGLIKFSEVGVGGFRHAPEVEDSFLVRLQIHEWEIEAVEVILGDDSYGLLGRDVLNRFLLTLDGPGLNFTLQLPTSPTPN